MTTVAVEVLGVGVGVEVAAGVDPGLAEVT
jgi:hypothetical protein